MLGHLTSGDVNHLRDEELQYEKEARGQVAKELVAERRKQLWKDPTC